MGDQGGRELKSFVTYQRRQVCGGSKCAIRSSVLKKASDSIFDCQKEARGLLYVGRNGAQTPGFEIPNIKRFAFIPRPKYGHMHMYTGSPAG